MVSYISLSKNYFHLNNSLLIHNFDLNGCYYIVCYYTAILLVLVFILLLGAGLILYTKTNQPESKPHLPVNPSGAGPEKPSNPKENFNIKYSFNCFIIIVLFSKKHLLIKSM